VSASIAGASAGRGFGNGTVRAVRRGFGRLSPNRPLQGSRAAWRAAAADTVGPHSISTTAAAVTIPAALQRKPPQGHLRRAFSALKFMPIP
jgi:hypothetical protein